MLYGGLDPGGCPRIGCPTARQQIGLKIRFCSANSLAIYLTKPNFYPQFSVVLATGAILGQPPRKNNCGGANKEGKLPEKESTAVCSNTLLLQRKYSNWKNSPGHLMSTWQAQRTRFSSQKTDQ